MDAAMPVRPILSRLEQDNQQQSAPANRTIDSVFMETNVSAAGADGPQS
jgi:hypothetical protein